MVMQEMFSHARIFGAIRRDYGSLVDHPPYSQRNSDQCDHRQSQLLAIREHRRHESCLEAERQYAWGPLMSVSTFQPLIPSVAMSDLAQPTLHFADARLAGRAVQPVSPKLTLALHHMRTSRIVPETGGVKVRW